MVRIPGSFNAKCLEAAKSLEESQVKLLQKWNGIRPKMSIEMLTDFKGYLVNLKIQELDEGQQLLKKQHYSHYYTHDNKINRHN
jgi:ERCC4-type nuclease